MALSLSPACLFERSARRRVQTSTGAFHNDNTTSITEFIVPLESTRGETRRTSNSSRATNKRTRRKVAKSPVAFVFYRLPNIDADVAPGVKEKLK